MKSIDDMKALYDRLYKAKPGLRSSGKVLQAYGAETIRIKWIMRWILNHVPFHSTVLDAGCGRGDLIRALRLCQYNVHGTEISTVAIEKHLQDLPVKFLPYEQLDKLNDCAYDLVISDDVLEHLRTEDLVREAIRNLARVSREWLIVTVGLHRAQNYVGPLGLDVDDLHFVRHKQEWWYSELVKVIDVVDQRAGRSAMFLCRKARRK